MNIKKQPQLKDPEIVICAAVRAVDGYIVRCHRHSDGMRTVQSMPRYAGTRIGSADDQGFITSRNRYVTRKEAMELQWEADIRSVDPDGYHSEELFSEDLY